MLLFLLNAIWFVLGGFLAAIGWALAGVIMALTIVGLPWVRSCFVMARYSMWPFGYDIVSREEAYGRPDLGTGTLGTLGNIVWFLLAGWWLAIMHLAAAVSFAVTIIGLPFAWAHFKLALASLFPVGKTVVEIQNHVLMPGLRNRVQRV
jgi:uncharacterized membrane protein YccF (DUF307 family)